MSFFDPFGNTKRTNKLIFWAFSVNLFKFCDTKLEIFLHLVSLFRILGVSSPERPYKKPFRARKRAPLAETFPPKAVLQLVRDLFQRRVGRDFVNLGHVSSLERHESPAVARIQLFH